MINRLCSWPGERLVRDRTRRDRERYCIAICDERSPPVYRESMRGSGVEALERKVEGRDDYYLNSPVVVSVGLEAGAD